jgi:hydroxypyruvate reductase 1
MAKPISIEVWNPSGKYRVVSTKSMPGTRWIRLLTDNDCRLEVFFLSAHCSAAILLCTQADSHVCLPRWQICTEQKTILSVDDILALIGDRCDGVIGQLTEDWGDVLFSALKRAGGTAFSNMAVGYNNVDVEAANRNGIAVGNTPVSLSCRCCS